MLSGTHLIWKRRRSDSASAARPSVMRDTASDDDAKSHANGCSRHAGRAMGIAKWCPSSAMKSPKNSCGSKANEVVPSLLAVTHVRISTLSATGAESDVTAASSVVA